MAIGVVGATSVSEFWAASDSCQQWYYANLLGIKEEFAVSASPERPLIVSPNPFRNGAFIHYFCPKPGNLRLTVVDATGRVAHEESFEVEAGSGKLFWRARGLAQGIYFLKLTGAGTNALAKFLLLN
ncbi:MAG: T9SS type A sorting domain-containing protein [bacterium]